MNDYKALSVNYEYLQPREEVFKQAPFFKKLIEQYAVKSCLDCACGPGWHLYMLNRMNIVCSGSDLSVSMLKKASENLDDQSVILKRENFMTLENSWKERYDMVICMTTSFPHLDNEKEAAQALNSMYERLNPGGIAIIDNGFSDMMFSSKPKFIPARIGEKQAFYFFMDYAGNEKFTVNILNVIKTKTGFEHAFDSVEYMVIGKAKFDELFQKTSFSQVTYYGDFDFSEYSTLTSKRIIAVAQK